MKRRSLFVLLLFCVATTSGCVTGRRSITLEIPPASTVASSSRGSLEVVSVTDNRVFENKPTSPSVPSIDGDVTKVSKDTLKTMIGRQRNGYGKAMGDIELASGETVETQTRRLISDGFSRHGYTVVDSHSADVTVQVSIDKFWAWFSPGFWAVSFESQVGTEMTIMRGSKSEKLTVTGYGKNSGQVAKDANWQLAYARAFEDFLKNFDTALAHAGL